MKQFYLKAIVVLLFCIAGGKAIAYDCEVDGIYYNLSKTANTASVTYKYSNSSNVSAYTGACVIPESIIYMGQTYSVTGIDGEAFAGCKNMTSIEIPNTVTTIGSKAFKECSSLTSIIIPNGVTSIGTEAFMWCSSLTSIIIPDGVTSIESGMFYYCSSLTSVTIPHSVTTIGISAFNGCSSLASIFIPSSVTKIENYAFSGSAVAKTLVIEDSDVPLKLTGSNYFAGSSLDSVYIGRNLSYDNSPLAGCKSRFAVMFGPFVTEIGEKLFNSCIIGSVVIPHNVKRIGKGAFLLDWYDKPDSVVYESIEQMCDIIYEDSYSKPVGTKTIVGGKELTSLEIPVGITSVPDYAFYGVRLSTINITHGVTTIGKYAFNNCEPETIILPNSLTSIGEMGFCSGGSDGARFSRVISRIQEPFEIGTNTFSSSKLESMVLYVPFGTKEKYQSTNYWNRFRSIIEGDPTEIREVHESHSQDADYHDLSGKCLDTPKQGLNIIRMSDGTVRKVMVK